MAVIKTLVLGSGMVARPCIEYLSCEIPKTMSLLVGWLVTHYAE